jgi:hypothetical protein
MKQGVETTDYYDWLQAEMEQILFVVKLNMAAAVTGKV